MRSIEQLVKLRASGGVKRCHTHTYHGSYTVAEHCWNILVLGAKMMPVDLYTHDFVVHALLHDCAEWIVGDIPAPVKWSSPELKSLLDSIEADAERQLVGEGGLPKLTAEQHDWLKLLDIMELGMWCVDQATLGNETIMGILQTCLDVGTQRKKPHHLVDEILKGFESVLESRGYRVGKEKV